MPVYPANKTYKGGFYNNIVTGGLNDRVYNAIDMRKPYDVIYSDGVKPDADGTAGDGLKVSADGGNMSIKLATGFAKIGGAWFENTAVYTIGLDAPTSNTRYDCVIIQNDDTQSVRSPNVYIKSLPSVPTVSNLTRAGGIYEICVAYIQITSATTFVTDAMITDTRTEGNLCNVMSGVGAMVVRTYSNTYFSGALNQTDIPIGIPQYDRTRDTIVVMVEGRALSAGQYTVISNTTVRLAIGLPVLNTRVDFQVAKNVNAAGADTVVQEVAYLTEEVAKINKVVEDDYYCNGLTDNVRISQMVAAFIADNTVAGDSQYHLTVHGKFGATAKYANNNWFVVGATDTSIEKRVIVDFADCEKVYIAMSGATDNNIFFGINYTIKNLHLMAACFAANCNCTIHASVVGGYTCENCRVNLVTTGTATYALEGTHINCDVVASSANNDAMCFAPTQGAKPVTVIGGKYRAYSGTAGRVSAVFYTASAATNAVIVALGVNCPTSSRTGFNQSRCIQTAGGYITASGLITALTNVTTGSTASLTGTIPISKP